MLQNWCGKVKIVISINLATSLLLLFSTISLILGCKPEALGHCQSMDSSHLLACHRLSSISIITCGDNSKFDEGLMELHINDVTILTLKLHFAEMVRQLHENLMQR